MTSAVSYGIMYSQTNEREVTTMTYYEITAYELAYTEGREEELKEELEKWFEEHPEERL